MSRSRSMAWLLCGCLLWAGPASAQTDDSTSNRGEVDLQRLIESTGQGRGGGNFQDPVWEVRPETGKQVFLMPMLYLPGDTTYSVSRPEVSPRGARFVGFYIPSAQDPQNLGRGRGGNERELDLATLASGDLAAIEALLLAEPEDPQVQRELERQQLELEEQRRRQIEQDALIGIETPEEGTPDFAPRLARSFTISPEGEITWEVDRSMYGAQVKQASEQNPYGYKLDPQAIRDAEPPRQERLVRQANEDSRAFSERRRQQQLEYRALTEEYRELRDRIRELPDRFTEPMPEVVYAVFLADDGDMLELQGPAPYPWKLTSADAENLRLLAQNRGGGGAGRGPAVETARAISVLRNFLADRHPLSYRAVAVAAYQANLPGQVLEGDPGYRLINDLLAADDVLARQVTLASIAQTQPPTRASAKLLADAARSAPPELAETLELASLRAMFAIDAQNTENAGFLVTLVNEAIRDETGPPAGLVIDELLRALGGEGNTNRRNNAVDGVDVVLINRVDFTIVPEDQLDGVIAAVIRRAPENPTASGWLDIKLLRSGDDRLIQRTLELLSQADAGSILVKPLTADLRDLVFGQAPAGSNNAALDLTLSSVIPLDSDTHGIITALTSTDPARRALAWQVLRHFEIASTSGAGDAQAATFGLIVDTGLRETDTPLYLIDFIDNQQEGTLAQRSAERMNQVLLQNIGRSAAMRAARKYVASPQRYGQVLPQIDPLERGVIIERLYELLTGEIPAVVGLARDPQGQQTRWFVDELVKTGTLPTEKQWAGSMTEDALLRAVASPDNSVSSAAAAALVVNAGGNRSDLDRFFDAISRMATRDAEAVFDAWVPIKQEAYARVLADATGPYRLVMTLRGDHQPGFGNGFNGANPAPRPVNPGEQVQARPAPAGDLSLPVIRQIELGIVELSVDRLTVTLSAQELTMSVPTQRLALRLDNVSALATFNNPDTADLPLSQLQYSLELLPQDDGSWTGAMQLPDGRTAQLTLQPS